MKDGDLYYAEDSGIWWIFRVENGRAKLHLNWQLLPLDSYSWSYSFSGISHFPNLRKISLEEFREIKAKYL